MRRLMILVSVVGLIAAGCNGGAGDTTSTTGDATSTTDTTMSVPETTTSSAGEPTTTVGETTTTAAAASGGSDCLVGTWVLDNDAFMENLGSIFADAGMPDADVAALGGTFTVELGPDGSLNATRDEWGFDMDTGEGAVVIEVDGTETGTWSADETTLTVSTDTSDLDVGVSVEVDGEMVEMPSEFQPEFDVPQGIATDSTYTCSGDVLTLTNEGVESVLNRA